VIEVKEDALHVRNYQAADGTLLNDLTIAPDGTMKSNL